MSEQQTTRPRSRSNARGCIISGYVIACNKMAWNGKHPLESRELGKYRIVIDRDCKSIVGSALKHYHGKIIYWKRQGYRGWECIVQHRD